MPIHRFTAIRQTQYTCRDLIRLDAIPNTSGQETVFDVSHTTLDRVTEHDVYTKKRISTTAFTLPTFLTICPDTNLQFLEWKPKTK